MHDISITKCRFVAQLGIKKAFEALEAGVGMSLVWPVAQQIKAPSRSISTRQFD